MEICCLRLLDWFNFGTRKCRLQRTKRLRHLFEQMDKKKTGTLTLDQFKEYMARENPRSVKRAAEIFAAMGNRHQEHSQEDGCKVATVSFIEVLDLSAKRVKTCMIVVLWVADTAMYTHGHLKKTAMRHM